MPSARFEYAINRLMIRARLLERVAYDPGPWSAIAHGCIRAKIPLERHERPDDHFVLTGYLDAPCSNITSVEIWCRDELVAAWPADYEDSPVRITLDLGIEDTELAS